MDEYNILRLAYLRSCASVQWVVDMVVTKVHYAIQASKSVSK
jgi:hypothetical protein